MATSDKLLRRAQSYCNHRETESRDRREELQSFNERYANEIHNRFRPYLYYKIQIPPNIHPIANLTQTMQQPNNVLCSLDQMRKTTTRQCLHAPKPHPNHTPNTTVLLNELGRTKHHCITMQTQSKTLPFAHFSNSHAFIKTPCAPINYSL